jgi:riboflavin synthase
MQAGARFSGHFVQGHVDGTGSILAWEPCGRDYRLEVSVPAEFHRLIIPRGSITVDGISLTVAEIVPGGITMWITPHTRAVTNLLTALPGRRVNLEIDMFAKYIDQLLLRRAEVTTP